MIKLINVLLISLLITVSGIAQTGKIAGKILNEKNEPLPGVSVKIAGITRGTSSDVEGRYSLTLSAGKKYVIVFSAVGYDEKSVEDVEVNAGETIDLSMTLPVTSKKMGEVTVIGSRTNLRKESINSLIQFQKNTNTVAAVISAESIRRSPDKNTGEVLKRVPGTSIQEGKYLVVRGLGDRYNFAMLNGVPLSSTEPDRKTFSFDIFPSSMIDNIIINKAFVPELPGEWAGGLVQVNTKDIPANDFINVTLGTGFNAQTIGKDFYTYKGGKYDWLGIDDGFRSMPSSIPTKSSFSELDAAAKTEFGKKFKNVWSSEKDNSTLSLLNRKFELNGGFNRSLRGRKKLGVMLGLTYNESAKKIWFHNMPSNADVIAKTATPIFDYNNEKYAKDVLWGGLANITLKIGNNSKVSWKNLFNVNATNYVTERTGLDYNDANGGQRIKARELALKSNMFFNTQLSGDHNLEKIKTKLHWYGSFNILDQYIPDQRRIQYNQETSLPGNPYLLLAGASKGSQTSGSRYYGFLNDYIYAAGADITKSFKLFGLNQSIKGGYLFQVKDRLFDSRPFAYYLSSDNATLRQLPADQIFAPANFGNGNDDKFGFSELSGHQYRYMANTILNAGYIQFDNQFTDALRATWGVRVEDYDQVIGSLKESDIRHLHSHIRDYLPGMNITYKIGNSNIRLSGSQTVIRPEFRELSDFQFYDFDLGATLTGNGNLQRTKVTNADIRYEMYPRSGEVFTIGVFFKHFTNPIELYFNTASGGASTYNYINADKATGYGIELEYRKKLDFAQVLHNFTFQTNLSYIYNRVESKGASLDRPMQGQSPYVFNASLQYDLERIGFYTTLLYNQVGDRIFYVGGSDQPPVWEATRPLIDFQIAKKIINKRAELKLNVSDIMNRMANFYLDFDENNRYNKGKDALIIERRFGTTFNISFSYNIK